MKAKEIAEEVVNNYFPTDPKFLSLGMLNNIQELAQTYLDMRQDFLALQVKQKGNIQLLNMCKEKLEIYRNHSNGKYHGGIEHTALIRMIDTTLNLQSNDTVS